MKSKTTLISYGLFVAMIVCWLIDVNDLLLTPLMVGDVKIGVHYLPEFFLLGLWTYQIRKDYDVKYSIYVVVSIILFWIVTYPLNLNAGYDFYWALNSCLLFLNVILIGILFATFERRVRKWQ